MRALNSFWEKALPRKWNHTIPNLLNYNLNNFNIYSSKVHCNKAKKKKCDSLYAERKSFWARQAEGHSKHFLDNLHFTFQLCGMYAMELVLPKSSYFSGVFPSLVVLGFSVGTWSKYRGRPLGCSNAANQMGTLVGIAGSFCLNESRKQGKNKR